MPLPSAASLELLRLRAEAYMERNFDRPGLTVDLVAAKMGCSPSYMHRAFRCAGLTPADFLWAVRLNRARGHLRDPALSVSDVAFATGFSSSAHFARLFRRRFGLAPREWRRDAAAVIASPRRSAACR